MIRQHGRFGGRSGGPWGLPAAITAALLLFCPPGRLEAARPPKYQIEGIPHIKQKPDYCGEACVSMGLSVHGKSVSQDEVFEKSGLSAEAGRGCYARDLYQALANLGVGCPDPWIQLPEDRTEADRIANDAWQGIKQEVSEGRPVIVCSYFANQANTTEHFRLIVGYDDPAGQVIYHDPALDDGAYKRMPLALFGRLWPLKSSTGGRYLVRFHLPVPSEGPVPMVAAPSPAATAAPAAADEGPLSEHVAAMKARMGSGYLVAAEPPFVLAGNIPRKTFDSDRELLRWIYKQYVALFFDKMADPAPLFVYLFANDRDYRDQSVQLFGHHPDTGFGYYWAPQQALVMNIQTGTGTLLHEMIHPLVAADFPAAPSWLNEGLGSLFERCTERDGQVVGRLNWRLPALQQAIQRRTMPALSSLLGASASEFYGKDAGMHYAMARYLLYWLQEKRLLPQFYKRFRQEAAGDPTGQRTLETMLGKPLDGIQVEWEAFVKGLDASQAR